MQGSAPPAPPLTRAALWVLGAALLARLALLGVAYPRHHRAVLLFDSGAYLRSGQALLSAGRFSISPSRASEPEIVRTPGYPAMIAAVFALGGPRLGLPAGLNAP